MDLALVSVINVIYTTWESKQMHLAIVMDLSKAFDTLDHISLLQSWQHKESGA